MSILIHQLSSTYTEIIRGEELGLQEVAVIEERQDPTFFRTNGSEIGRDGCRVPIPWTKEGTNFGFGNGKPAHLVQPDWMGEFAVETMQGIEGSTLDMYQKALKLRKTLQTTEKLEWVNEAESEKKDMLHFKREGGWEVILNFNGEGVEVPEGAEVLISSGPLDGKKVPMNTAVWFKR